MYKKIQELCKLRGTNITNLCEQVTGSTGNLSTWKKGYMRSDYLSKAADILDCSVDYLLGRTNNPTSYNQDNNSGNIINGSNGNNSPLTVQNEEPTEMEKEISSILSGMSYRERTELMCLIYKFVDEHKKI